MAASGNEAVDAVFDEFGVDAVYAPPDGDPVACRVIWKHPDGTFAGHVGAMRTTTRMADVRAAELPDPQEGATLTVEGKTYTLAAPGFASDKRRRLRRMELNG